MCWLWTSQKNVGYFAGFEQVVNLPTTTQLGRLWLPTPHCALPVWLTGRYATPLVTSYFPPNSCYHECYGFERAFFTLKHSLPYTPSCFFQGFSTWRLAGLNADLGNCPDPTICLNHSNPQKFYAGRFYLGVMAGRLMMNLLLTGFELGEHDALSVWPRSHTVWDKLKLYMTNISIHDFAIILLWW